MSKRVLALLILLFVSVNDTYAQNLINGNFSDSTSHWDLILSGNAVASYEVIDGMLSVIITESGAEVGDIQLTQDSLTIERIVKYEVSFDAAADAAREITVAVTKNSDDFAVYDSEVFTLSSDTATYSFSFTMRGATDTNARIVFELGQDDTNLILDNVSVKVFGETEPAELRKAPFSRGVNITTWFQSANPQQINFTKYSKQDFINIKSLGADVIRLPINLHSMTEGAPDYTLDPLFVSFLDQVVDWAEELEIHLILDNHTFSPSDDTDPQIGDILIPVWQNMATRYKDRSSFIHFEILNEPHGISEADWNAIQADAVMAIREIDSTRSILIGGSSFNSYNSLQYIPDYADTNLIYTYHFYDPFILTHQGATWTSPSMLDLSGVPFPYDAGSMPEFPSSLNGTWMQSSFNNYDVEGTEAKVKEWLDVAIDFAVSRGVPVFCGEFGVYKPNSDNQSRVNWYGLVTDYLTEHGVAWTSWDYKGGFGIFENGTDELFDYHLNVPLIEAMGFNVPQQYEYSIRPDSAGFEIYTDYLGNGITNSSGENSTLSFYDESDPKSGDYSISWSGASQYNNIGFNFSPDKNLSYLIENGFILSLWVKGNDPEADFDLRFIDTKTEEEGDHPWRMFKRITHSEVPFNGEWQYLEVSLSDFAEMGSWDVDTWYEPQGDFDWTAVDNLNIVAETGAHTGEIFLFDDIRIVEPAINSTENSDIISDFKLFQNYPNPFNPATSISYQLASSQFVSVTVYDMLGREVSVLVNGVRPTGRHVVNFDATGLSSGVYIYELKAGGQVQQKKMLLIK